MTEELKIHPNKLKGIRVVDLDMTQERMAEGLGWAKSTYNRYEQEPDKIQLGRAVEIFNYIYQELYKIEKEKGKEDDEINININFGDIFFS